MKITAVLLLILPFVYGYIYFVGFKSFETKDFYTIKVVGEPELRVINTINQPIITTELVKDWVTETMVGLYNYNSTDFLDKKSVVRDNFSSRYAPLFWDGFIEGVEENISTGVQITDTIVSMRPIVVSEAVINGRRAWKFYLELYHVYKSEARSQGLVDKSYVMVTAMEQDTRKTKKGIAIDYIKIK